MSVEATAENIAKAPVATAKGLVKLVQDKPVGALVVFAIIILIVLRYRNAILRAFGMVPVVGTKAQAFAGGGTVGGSGVA